MSQRAHVIHKVLLIAGAVAATAGLIAVLAPAADASLHAGYTRRFVGPSSTQRLVYVAVDAATLAAWGAPPWPEDRRVALATAIGRGAPRLVIWPSEQVPGDSSAAPVGIEAFAGRTLVRAADPGFPALALAELGEPLRTQPLPVRFTSRLPTVSALRVAAGEIPAATFRDRVVVIGRSDAAAATIATPLGPMSLAQVEAHALLGVLDGATWAVVPGWLKLAALGLWVLALVAALRGRTIMAMLAIGGLAGAASVALDAGLFAGGVLQLGITTPVLVALAVAAWKVRARLRARARAEREPAAQSMAGASAVRRWSGA